MILQLKWLLYYFYSYEIFVMQRLASRAENLERLSFRRRWTAEHRGGSCDMPFDFIRIT
jgi:hypothetical protein